MTFSVLFGQSRRPTGPGRPFLGDFFWDFWARALPATGGPDRNTGDEEEGISPKTFPGECLTPLVLTAW